MESLPSKNKNVKYLLCVIDVFTKHAWVKPLIDIKCKTVLNAFIEIVNKFNCKPNKLLIVNQINYGWIKVTFTINLCKNG